MKPRFQLNEEVEVWIPHREAWLPAQVVELIPGQVTFFYELAVFDSRLKKFLQRERGVRKIGETIPGITPLEYDLLNKEYAVRKIQGAQ